MQFAKPQYRRPLRGFTLVELLVVIAIICLLAAILFPVFNLVREKARQSSCASNEKQIGLGLAQYVEDYDGYYPAYAFSAVDGTYWPWELEVYPYIKNEDVFLCPSRKSGALAGANRTLTSSAAIAAQFSVAYPFLSSYGGNTTARNNCDSSNGWNNPHYGVGVFGTQGRSWGADVLATSAMPYPTTTIELFEVVENATVNPGIDTAAAVSSQPASLPILWNSHTSTGNYLFVDGHVKALQASKTISSTINMWTRDNSQDGPLTPNDVPQCTPLDSASYNALLSMVQNAQTS